MKTNVTLYQDNQRDHFPRTTIVTLFLWSTYNCQCRPSYWLSIQPYDIQGTPFHMADNSLLSLWQIIQTFPYANYYGCWHYNPFHKTANTVPFCIINNSPFLMTDNTTICVWQTIQPFQYYCQYSSLPMINTNVLSLWPNVQPFPNDRQYSPFPITDNTALSQSQTIQPFPHHRQYIPVPITIQPFSHQRQYIPFIWRILWPFLLEIQYFPFHVRYTVTLSLW